MSAPAALRDIRAYLGMFRMKLIAGTQYRAAAWAGVSTQFFWGFMLLMIYRAFYDSSSADPGMEFSQLVCYIWLQQGLLVLVRLWSQDSELLESVSSGTVAYELCRPVGLYGFWFVRVLGARLSSVSLHVLPLTLVVFFLPAPFTMSPPAGAQAAAGLAVSLALGALLVAALSMFILIVTLIWLTPSGARGVIGMTAEFFMGTLMPLPMMPQAVQNALSLMPFRYVFDVPARIYSGHIAGGEAWLSIGVQALWIVLLVPLGVLALKRALRRTVIQGG